MFSAFDMTNPGSVVDLAMKILQTDEMNHTLAVQMATAVREATISLVASMALVTHLQDPTKPIVAITEAEAAGEDSEGHSPLELLEALSAGFPGIEEEWDKLVVAFKERYNEWKVEVEVSKIPENFTVSDVLGESKPKGERDYLA